MATTLNAIPDRQVALGVVAPMGDPLRALEAESIQIMREVVAEFERPVMLYSIGKDSSVLLRLAQKAFYPGPIPFPLLHVDTTTEPIADGTQPFKVGTQRCCGLLKTKSLLDGLAAGNFDAAIGGARRDEERSRAKERVVSVRDPNGQWDPKRQRPELWNLLNGRIRPGESIRVFPLSNWTEIDIWQYIHVEKIPIVPLYYAREREVIVRGPSLIVQEQPFVVTMPGEKPQVVKCRMRSLGCSPCTGAVRSDADTIPKIIEELIQTKQSERLLRIIDHDQDGSMELKKREGYF